MAVIGYPDPSYAKHQDPELHAAGKRLRHWMAAGHHVGSRVELHKDLDTLLSRLEANTALTKRLHRRTQFAEAAMATTVQACRREGVSLGRKLAIAALGASETLSRALLEHAEEQQEQIREQKRWIGDLLSQKHVNCVFCGYRYSPADFTPVLLDPTALLRAHIAQCKHHPLHETREALLELFAWHQELRRFAHHMPDGGAALEESIERARRALAEQDGPASGPLQPAVFDTTTEGNPS